MPIGTDFLAWAIGTGANVMPQATYASNPAVSTGVQIGEADPTLANKTWRQASVVANAITSWMSTYSGNYIYDDGDIAAFIANFELALRAFSPLAVLVAPAAFYINPLTGTDTSSSGSLTQPFATLSYAYAWLQGNINANGQQITLNCAFPSSPTSYAPFTANGPVSGVFSPAQLLIVGDNTSQACQIAISSLPACVQATNFALFKMTGFNFQATGSVGTGITQGNGANVVLDHCTWGTCVDYCISTGVGGGVVDITSSNLSINSAGIAAMLAAYGGTINMQNATINFGSGSTFSSGTLAAIDGGKLIVGNTVSFTGSMPNAPRFNLQGLSLMDTDGRQALVSTAYVPGTTDGLVSGGSQFF